MFTEYLELNDRDLYEFYLEKRKKPLKTIQREADFKKIVGGLFLEIKNQIVNSKEGVCIKDLGYFCNIKKPNKVNNLKAKSLIKKYQGTYHYYPFFNSDTTLPEDWSMDYTFNKNIIKLINNTEIQYNFYPNVCDGIITLEDSTKAYLNAKKSNNKGYIYKKENRI